MQLESLETTDEWNHDDESHRKSWIRNEAGGISILLTEYPRAVSVQLCVDANLPGGYDVIDKELFQSVDDAVSEINRRIRQYDHEGTWIIDGAPLLH